MFKTYYLFNYYSPTNKIRIYCLMSLTKLIFIYLKQKAGQRKVISNKIA